MLCDFQGYILKTRHGVFSTLFSLFSPLPVSLGTLNLLLEPSHLATRKPRPQEMPQVGISLTTPNGVPANN